MYKSKKGITLIALVVTIIVLLILAGISISMLSGDNSILQKATDAKTQTGVGQEKETIALAYNSALAKKVGNGDSSTVTGGELDNELDSSEANASGDNPITVTFIKSNRQYTIDGNGKISQITTVPITGITLDKTTLTLSDSEKTETITAIITPYNTIETVVWSSSDESIATVTAGEITVSGTTATATATVTGKGTGSVTITVAGATTTSVSATCAITSTVVSKYIDKSYVDYNVSYTDVYTGTEYTSDTGWRLLTDLSAYETAGTYTGNIEIISTGIPAILYEHYDSIQSFENTNPKTIGKWAGDSTQRSTYTGTYYNSSSPYTNIYAAAGLMYNFENIVFNYSGTKDTLTTSNISKEYGGYVSISNGGSAVTASNSTTGASLFRVSNLASGTIPEGGIRSVSLKDLTGLTTSDTTFTDKRTGLFILQDYTPDKHNSSGCYLLASPEPSSAYTLRFVNYNGSINAIMTRFSNRGLRPVVSISGVTLKLNGNVWEIQ